MSESVDELAVLLDEFFAADSIFLGCMHHDRGQAEIHDVASVLVFEKAIVLVAHFEPVLVIALYKNEVDKNDNIK